MPTSPYFTKDGTQVPSVTTVIGGSLGWNKDPLLKWAWRMGKLGKDYEKIRQKAADAGNLAHEMCERFLMGMPYTPDQGVPGDVAARAHNGFAGFLRWFKQTKYTAVACEFKLVSEKLRVGGTPDVLFLDGGEIFRLGDFKTSKKAYADHLIQTVAYAKIIEEVMGIGCESVEILALGRESARFKHYSWPVADLEPAWQAFLRLRELHDLRWLVEAAL